MNNRERAVAMLALWGVGLVNGLLFGYAIWSGK